MTSLPVTVYLEDTDAMGVVYNASYVRFIERARSESIGSKFIMELIDRGINLMIYKLNAKFHQPGRLGDQLVVQSEAILGSAYRVIFDQKVLRGEALLFGAKAHIVCVDPSGTLKVIPDEVKARLQLA